MTNVQNRACLVDRRLPAWIPLLLLALWGGVSTAYGDSLAGPAFGDPSQVVEMPRAWQELPVEHAADIAEADLAINLDQQMYRILAPKVTEYAERKKLKIAISDSTCGNSAGLLSRKRIDIGGFCCPAGDTDRLPGLRFHTLGIAAVALFVHPSNPISNLSLDQARKVYQGEIYRWQDLGEDWKQMGSNSIITTVGRLHCKRRPGHWRMLLDNEDLFSPTLKEVGAIPDMVSTVASLRTAIGHETVWLARHHYRSLGEVKLLSIDGQSPEDLAALIRGDYPIYKVFQLTTWAHAPAAKAEASELVRFLIAQVEQDGEEYGVAAPSRLKEAGWQFMGDELIGAPNP